MGALGLAPFIQNARSFQHRFQSLKGAGASPQHPACSRASSPFAAPRPGRTSEVAPLMLAVCVLCVVCVSPHLLTDRFSLAVPRPEEVKVALRIGGKRFSASLARLENLHADSRSLPVTSGCGRLTGDRQRQEWPPDALFLSLFSSWLCNSHKPPPARVPRLRLARKHRHASHSSEPSSSECPNGRSSHGLSRSESRPPSFVVRHIPGSSASTSIESGFGNRSSPSLESGKRRTNFPTPN